MEEAKVHCPGCQLALRVPANAAGRTARCPACHKAFVIPKPDELVEETISTWIEQDIDQLKTEHEKQWEARFRTMQAQEHERERERQRKRGHKPGPLIRDEDHPMGRPRPHPEALLDPFRPSTPVTPAPPPTPPPVRAPGLGYPEELRPTGPAPHIIVEDCNQDGVKLAFDSIWLEHMGFRLSMPVRGILSGESDPAKLLARPLAFVDRSQARVRSPQEIESRYERRLGDDSPHRWIELAGLIDHLPPPFNHPVPYYVDLQHTGQSLKCSTSARPDGGITCHVMIPNGPYALQWLGNVNGVCGPEFAMLAEDIAVLWNDNWRMLSEECRQRLGVWCAFQPREQFRLYLLDAEFKRADMGMAGVVVTDQRFIYCKFHHRGQLDLNEEAILHAQVAGEFAELTLIQPDRRTRAAKLHTSDLDALEAALRHAPGLHFERSGR